MKIERKLYKIYFGEDVVIISALTVHIALELARIDRISINKSSICTNIEVLEIE